MIRHVACVTHRLVGKREKRNSFVYQSSVAIIILKWSLHKQRKSTDVDLIRS